MTEQSSPETQNHRGKQSSPVEIRIENLSKSFGRHRVLEGINLEINSGEMVAIVGGSGSGKTTLLRHVIGLDQPDRGCVLVADHESKDSLLVNLATLDAVRIARLERHWGVVFQGDALLLGQTVGYNIALPLRDVQHLDESTIRSRVGEVVREVALNSDNVLDLTIDKLSGGMAKRVAIARALALDPILLLYDEPTTGLDPKIAQQIQDLIGSAHRRKLDSGFARTSLLVPTTKRCSIAWHPGSSGSIVEISYSTGLTKISRSRIRRQFGHTLS
jgi:phospholipid/cholesterol/gamma-HCH transport system ATP-binding protein